MRKGRGRRWCTSDETVGWCTSEEREGWCTSEEREGIVYQ